MSTPIDSSHHAVQAFEPRLREFRGIAGIKLGDAIELLLEGPHATRVALHGSTSFLAVDWIQRRQFPQIHSISREQQLGIDAPACFLVCPEPNRPDFKRSTVDMALHLASLDQDDVIRFMLDHSPKACRSVIARLQPRHYRWLGSVGVFGLVCCSEWLAMKNWRLRKACGIYFKLK